MVKNNIYKVCKNCKNKKYNGKEKTPLGLGYHANGFEEGKRKKGRNGLWYIVKNKRWQKYTSLGSEQGLYPPITK